MTDEYGFDPADDWKPGDTVTTTSGRSGVVRARNGAHPETFVAFVPGETPEWVSDHLLAKAS
ncbi:hypothetical protein [Amycolatopsis albispora]|uniref:Uncharacterized protein n=1 Tax=Amycolatopsis albispora TaxID=1804986 RepID=A0A344LH03_9PSEU|nr:hypothetical protein [Amycolatopsis albispora]AXB47327.1 hypothetical protein A4R43_36780 [Amycolatopsis albispora]